MTKYKEIIGTDIEVVTTDPTVTGQVWYNESEGELKTRNQFVGSAWSIGGSLNTARDYIVGSNFGTQTAALGFAGYAGPSVSPRYVGLTEQYDGSSWTEVADLNTGRAYGTGGGTSTSAIAAGGYTGTINSNAETWDGSSWTEVSDLNTGRYNMGGAGSSNTNALIFGGTTTSSPVTRSNIVESWNGSSWTEVGNLNLTRYDLRGA